MAFALTVEKTHLNGNILTGDYNHFTEKIHRAGFVYQITASKAI